MPVRTQRQVTQQETELKRARTIAAAMAIVEQAGSGGLTVARITGRARVARSTFNELFDGTEGCFLAGLEQALAGLEDGARVAYDSESDWLAGVRAAVVSMLDHAERDRGLARICVVEALAGGPRVLELRERALGEAARAIERAAGDSAAAELELLRARGLAAGAVDLLHSRLLAEDPRPLHELQGPIVSMIVMPHLGRAAATQELHRTPSPPVRPAEPAPATPGRPDPLAATRMRVTYRTARVLIAIAEHPGASNRDVSRHADIADQGQASKLLKRLVRLQLIENTGAGHRMGASNEWHLTELGHEVLRATRGL